MSLLALWERPVSAWGVSDFLIALLIVVGCIAVAYVVITQVFKIQIPPWLVTVIWIVIGVFVGIFAIRLIASM